MSSILVQSRSYFKAIQCTYHVVENLDSPPSAKNAIFIHGNSASSKAFVHQMEFVKGNPLFRKVIFVDLPGHGQSEFPCDDAIAKDYYSFNGYAKLMIDILKYESMGSTYVVGWSLGGQIAYSMMKFSPRYVSEAILFGAPAVTDTDLICGFVPFDECVMMGQITKFTREEAIIFCKAGGLIPLNKTKDFDENEEAFIKDAEYCDGRSRSYMIAASTNGGGANARELVATCDIPIYTIIALRDGGVNNDYIRSLTYKNNKFYEIDSRHATQYECPEEFNKILTEIFSQ